ncbi:MAG: DUF2264 domain-containing protein [Granulicella sp.]
MTSTLFPRRTLLKAAITTAAAAATMPFAEAVPAMAPAAANDRAQWIAILERVSGPVLEAIAHRQLKATMPVEISPGGDLASRRECTYLEAFGRLLCGIAPWLELDGLSGSEGALQAKYRELARAGIEHGTNPASPDYLNFGTSQQSVVDTAFLALAVVRAPIQLGQRLNPAARRQLVKALLDTRKILPGRNNWLLFSGMVEGCLCVLGEDWDRMRVDYAIEQHEQWYVGDGMYGDGPHFHWDYYNSFVIQPMLLNILDSVKPKAATWEPLRPVILQRAQRYAVIQERLISPEATFPAIGRSLAYRFGAFHHLAEISLRRELPESVAPEQVRSALTAVMGRMIAMPGTFDANGWLNIGFAGHQPSIGERYISTGSLYLCSGAWLPLGLPASDAFWSAPAKPWTQKKIWAGEDVKTDHAISV